MFALLVSEIKLKGEFFQGECKVKLDNENFLLDFSVLFVGLVFEKQVEQNLKFFLFSLGFLK